MLTRCSIAGTHTTSATTALLFYHLLYAPELLARCREEIDEKLPPLEPGAVAHPAATVEACLPYLRDCVKENFRITPVFTMPLARRIMAAEGLVIGEEHIPRGVGSPPHASKARLTAGTDIRCNLQSCLSPQPQRLGPGPHRL